MAKIKLCQDEACGGIISNESITVKFSDYECTIVVCPCEKCGRLYSESNAPISHNGKPAFFENGEAVLR